LEPLHLKQSKVHDSKTITCRGTKDAR